jgi:hypothetical protein
MIKFTRFLTIVLLFISSHAFAQPANDDICGAKRLAVSPTLSCDSILIGQTTLGATESLPACDGNANDDVWYSFVATSRTHFVTLTNSGLGNTDRVHQVFSSSNNTCSGTLTSLYCSDREASFNRFFIPGNTYFVRVHSYFTNFATFDICVAAPSTPINDNICGALNLGVSSFSNCTTLLTGQITVGASQSLQGCIGDADDDIWYSFVASSNTHIITLSSSGIGSNNPVHQVYSSSNNTCTGTLTSLTCANQLISTSTGLTIGNTYFVRVYSAFLGDFATYNICITSPQPPPPPLNDNICGAISLGVSPDLTCTTILAGQTSEFATQSRAACFGTADDDVWYSFVAISTRHRITLSGNSTGGGSTDRMHEVFGSSDNTCAGTLTSLTCSDPETSTTNGLTIGNTYFIRVYSFESVGFASFDICLTSFPPPPPTPPSNDDCIGATTLISQPNSAGCPSPLAGTTLGATTTTAPFTDFWFSSNDDDVWYQLNTGTGITSRTLRFCNVTFPVGAATNFAIELHSSCLTVGFRNNIVPILNGTGQIVINGLFEDRNYKIRVLTEGASSRANFNISLLNPQANSTFENEALSNVSIFPSPTEDKVAIQFSSEISGEAEMKIFDFLGRVVKNQTFSAMVGTNNSELSLGELPSGTYFVQVKTDSQSTKPVRVIKL